MVSISTSANCKNQKFSNICMKWNLVNIADSNIYFSGIVQENCYKLITRVEYPFFVDTSTKAEKILREFEYYVSMYIMNYSSVQSYLEEDLKEVKLPLQQVLSIYGMPKDVTRDETL